ncbi:2,3,4,5-tetrahydropyridine-2,6-carboxylate N-succinyltransferase [Roseovarius sp. A21]|uniref:2,3,4,5-tetrahydropyridine-2,6-carboxylate N-succinyltransferase n=1 Tax=Roseovarius bejariae TaxID=2576383 RepID=A0A844CN44_9RHOB|nr:choice-of-anchor L domain-containing protein [Roseovarius bejariae]MRU16032.1 2,3,4,5-tetrahydropyridine-2,6-carboxylate N-succinyltransferase [Roseovarius bejariae]
MPTASELQIDTFANAMDMANEMFGSGISLLSATYAGASTASGIYSGGDSTAPGITPSDTGVILSTGNASDITNTSGDANVFTDTSTDHGTAGDADLDATSGQTTFDAAIFEADFIPDGNTLTMQVVFSSEEYLEFINSGYNDAVGIWVNGQPAELTVGTGNISVDEINDQSNENLYVDNPTDAEVYNTEMDGFTVALTLKAPVNPGETNTIKIGIADAGDGAVDSNLLIAGDSIQTALVAADDSIEVRAGDSEAFDLLANDVSSAGSTLTITQINGQPVTVGDTVILPTGEQITMTPTGMVLAAPDADLGTNTFSYTVADTLGNTDIGFVEFTTTAPCFTAGTLIETPRGAVAIETLKVGDRVMTLDHGPQPLRWIGTTRRHAQGADAPVRINAGALGAHDMIEVSPNHRVFIVSPHAELFFGTHEVLVKAKHLVNGHSIHRRNDGMPVTYLHLLFDRHEVICGDGLMSESYHPGDQTRRSFDENTQSELLRLFPELANGSDDNWPAARMQLKQYEARLLNSLGPGLFIQEPTV